MRRRTSLLTILLLLMLTACSDASVSENAPSYDQETYLEIKITVKDTEVQGVLFDNETARNLAAHLPLTAPLWVPADFAKAFYLAEEDALYDSEVYTREYLQGGLAYWPGGNAVAIFHGADPEQTAVPVIIIGKLEGDVSVFANDLEEITIEALSED